MIPARLQWILDEPLDVVLASVPESFRELVEVIGLENTLKLSCLYGGQSIYVRQCETAFLNLRNDKIRGEFTGANHRELSRKYGLSLSQVYSILREEANA